MDAQWITSPTARRILAYWADPRPAWLWSQDGTTLLWRNAAARYVNGRIKKGGLKLGPEAVPIKGQVTRLIRLGGIGRSSLARVQFLAGDKPIATTCSCTPLALPDGQTALLLVGLEPVSAEVIETAGGTPADAMSQSLFPPGAHYLLVTNGAVLDGSPAARTVDGALPAGPPAEGEDAVHLIGGPNGETLVVILAPATTPEPAIGSVRAEEGVSADERDENDAQDLAHMPEPMLPLGLAPLPLADSPAPPSSEEWVEPLPVRNEGDHALSSLFDRLAEDAGLYTSLTVADDVLGAPLDQTSPEEPLAPAPEPDLIAAVIEYADDPETGAAPQPVVAPASHGHWLITGRGFRALDAASGTRAEPPPAAPPAEPIATLDAAPDAETAERVSRYNFEELGRILTDRVGGEALQAPLAPTKPAAPTRPAPPAVINLSAETLVLNRLPLAILVFRDQQVLFANRALTDLLGHESVESLRAAGIASIFPSEESASAGPVNQLVRRDGATLPVAARLQSVSWQGRAALMLSASPAEAPRGHEGAVRAFAEIAAEAREEGFVVADRAGIVRQLSAHGAALLGRPAEDVIGTPLAVLVDKADMEPLRAFLEKPARFAETTRPSLVAAAEDGSADLALFAEGQAGIVTGYFGFLRPRLRSAPAPARDDDADAPMLGRLSRGIRRPLNTIIGFADLIRSAAFGAVDTERYAEYGRDIRTAGLEIAVLVDELDDFTRLRDGRYAVRPADVDLGALLESCVVRVKAQAGAARVLVRSAIAEQLPRIHADRASLGQALLNLLASAIDQTPIGGSVIVSAQAQDDGGIAIHVRDGASNAADLGDRFVVFRDGVDKDGEQLQPVRSSVGLALTRSLLAVNACSLAVDPMAGVGTLFSLLIPAELVTPERPREN